MTIHLECVQKLITTFFFFFLFFKHGLYKPGGTLQRNEKRSGPEQTAQEKTAWADDPSQKLPGAIAMSRCN